MPEHSKARQPSMLLVEPETMLRRTVALTARSLGLADVHEAASAALARQMLRQQSFCGAIISINSGEAIDLGLLDQIREGDSASQRNMPIAVLAENCTGELLAALRERAVTRVIVKPFRARILLDAFGALVPPA
ncbi:DNA-binding transcriptional response regulator [Pseudoduganella aquatica]|uniref:response regulator n=1 Tax=Pseudoduganella aquatica TaxID=2660641 RepID=UPI001E3EE754|nr:response regulator [Pseudoduganella aquatica]